MKMEGKRWSFFFFLIIRIFFWTVQVECEWAIMSHKLLFFFCQRRHSQTSNYKQSAWTLFLLNPSTCLHFSTPILRKSNFRYLRASENTKRACSKDRDVHQQYVLFSLSEREDIGITFWPSQAGVVNTGPEPVSARQPGGAEWVPKDKTPRVSIMALWIAPIPGQHL